MPNETMVCTSKGRFGAEEMVQRRGIVGFEPIAKVLAL